MGVKGLQSFTEQCCPNSCVPVDLREMARRHARDHHLTSDPHPGLGPVPAPPTLVVDGMACVRQWYSCHAWVHGGQWKQFIHLLEEWIGAFTAAGIRLVFFFDGTVEEQKRAEWARRRLRVNRDVARLFGHLKRHGQQPGRQMFCLPAGLATFSSFALRSLGQEVHLSLREADYEVAAFALQHGCMGILSQDSDFLVYDSVPYLSVSQLRIDRMTTVLYSRDLLCRALRLHKAELPLLACLLGNDVVPEERMRRTCSRALAAYRSGEHPGSGPAPGDKVLAVAQFISSSRARGEGVLGPAGLDLPDSDRELLERGVLYYLLPGQQSPWGAGVPSSPPGPGCVMEGYVCPEVLQAARERHVRAESCMVYPVLYAGVAECSNSLEDEEDGELPPQALVFRRCRELFYGILLSTRSGENREVPTVREWFVFPSNQLKQADVVYPSPLNQSAAQPDLKTLWFGQDSDSAHLRLTSFLSVIGCEEFSEEHGRLDGSLLTVLCLLTYIALQVEQLSLEDVDAYLSQAVCLRWKTHAQLQRISVPHVDSRAVQLGSLWVRGLTHTLAANCACGLPLPLDQQMPWNTFDGLLFHSKYLLAHSSTPHHLLLEDNASWLSTFLSLRQKVLEACRRRGRAVRSRPRPWKPIPGAPVTFSQQWGEREQQHRGSAGTRHSRTRPRSRHRF